ncbi:MAG: hypothetical protein WAQ98_17275 [Blastocatellia bacterium]
MNNIEITEVVLRLCNYTSKEGGIAILAYTNAGTADLYVEGKRHTNILTEQQIVKGQFLHLRSSKAKSYIEFDLLSSISPELFIELGELYNRLLQARLSPEQMLELLK